MEYLKKEFEELMRGDPRVMDFVCESSLDGICYSDLENPENEWCNEKFWQNLGYDPKNLQPKMASWQSVRETNDLHPLNEFIDQLNTGAEEQNVGVLHFRHFSGQTIWLRHRSLVLRNESGTPIRLLRTFINITPEVISDKMLQLKHSLLESSFESFDNVLIFSIDLDYRFLMFNTAFKNATFYVYGTTVELGSSMLDCITVDEDRKKAKALCEQALQGENPHSIAVYGELKLEYFETRYQRICDNKGIPMGVTILSSNVTERVEAENQLKDAFDELEGFSSSISNDLRVPLRTLNNYASILQEEVGNEVSENAKHIIHEMARSANQMSSLIEDILLFSKAGNKDLIRHHTNMSAVVSDVIVEMRDNCDNYLFKVELEQLPDVFCDASLLRLVWTNLITNAIKYSSRLAHPTIIIRGVEEKDQIVFMVIDNGIGFDMKEYNKLFSVFKRLNKNDEFAGNGIGLAIVQRIIMKHGGRVWATSSPTAQTCFYFSLPKVMA